MDKSNLLLTVKILARLFSTQSFSQILWRKKDAHKMGDNQVNHISQHSRNKIVYNINIFLFSVSEFSRLFVLAQFALFNHLTPAAHSAKTTSRNGAMGDQLRNINVFILHSTLLVGVKIRLLAIKQFVLFSTGQ